MEMCRSALLCIAFHHRLGVDDANDADDANPGTCRADSARFMQRSSNLGRKALLIETSCSIDHGKDSGLDHLGKTGPGGDNLGKIWVGGRRGNRGGIRL